MAGHVLDGVSVAAAAKPGGGPTGLMSKALPKVVAVNALTSSIKNDKRLVKLAEKAGENKGAQEGIAAMTDQIKKGNLDPGIGTHDVSGTKAIQEARHRNGGRLYFRKTGDKSVEIVAKSDKANQDKVISVLQELYPKK